MPTLNYFRHRVTPTIPLSRLLLLAILVGFEGNQRQHFYHRIYVWRKWLKHGGQAIHLIVLGQGSLATDGFWQRAINRFVIIASFVRYFRGIYHHYIVLINIRKYYMWLFNSTTLIIFVIHSIQYSSFVLSIGSCVWLKKTLDEKQIWIGK